jgi:two-component system sensor histidine kinase KdpD
VGLGLAVAKGFVEVMGGELTIEDTPGGGVTMVISLHPVGTHAATDVIAHPTQAAPAAQRVEPEPAPAPTGSA